MLFLACATPEPSASTRGDPGAAVDVTPDTAGDTGGNPDTGRNPDTAPPADTGDAQVADYALQWRGDPKAESGMAIVPIGDFDDDGFDDVLVGEVPGGTNGAPSPEYRYVRGSAAPASGFVSALATARLCCGGYKTWYRPGDVTSGTDLTGDGVRDVAIIANGHFSKLGSIGVFPGPTLADASLETGAAVRLSADASCGSEHNLAYGFAHTVETGDFDGDGTADLLAGAPDAGFAYTWRGPFTEDRGCADADMQIEGSTASDAGLDLAAGRDLDGDGLDDLVLSTVDSVYVFHGPHPARATLDDAAIALSTGPVYDLRLLPDRTGDGYPELAVGAPEAEGITTAGESLPEGGVAWLWHGPIAAEPSLTIAGDETARGFGALVSDSGNFLDAGWLVSAPWGGWESDTLPGAVYLCDADAIGAIGASDCPARLAAAQGNIGFGMGAAVLGDLDADGSDDLIVGDPYVGGAMGISWLILGGCAEPSSSTEDSAATTTPMGAETADLAGRVSVDGAAAAWQTDALEAAGYVTPAGDLDGDGLADFAIYGRGSVEEEIPHVAYGIRGSPDLAGGALSQTAAFQTVAGTGWYNSSDGVVAPAGDLDGDGFDGLAFIRLQRGTYVGDLLLHDGLTIPADYADGATFITADATCRNGSEVPEAFAGWTATGDLDGDGTGDLIVAAPQSPVSGGGIGGAVLAWYGPVATDTSCRTADVRVEGSRDGVLGAEVVGGQDLDGDGLDEWAAAAPGEPYWQPYSVVYLFDGTQSGELSVDAAVATYAGDVSALAIVADRNGDGRGELAIGDSSGSAGGAVWVWNGPVSGDVAASTASLTMLGDKGDEFGGALADAGRVTQASGAHMLVGAWGFVCLLPPDAEGTLAPSDCAVTFTGGERFDSVAGPGDVDGDGWDDLLLAPGYQESGHAAWLFLGWGG